jgi:hypothetical protein
VEPGGRPDAGRGHVGVYLGRRVAGEPRGLTAKAPACLSSLFGFCLLCLRLVFSKHLKDFVVQISKQSNDERHEATRAAVHFRSS